MIVIKKITNAREYDNALLRDTCVFHAIRRADEMDDVDSLGGHPLDDLRSRDAVAAALREGRTVFAVYQGTIEMPVVLANVSPVGSGKNYVAAARILVKLNIGRELDSWVRQQFANRFRRTLSDAKLVRALILNGIENDFCTLFNKEKEELLLKYGINSTDFPDLGDKLRGWCSIVRVLAFQPALSSSPRSGFYNSTKAEVEEIMKPTWLEMLMDVLEIWEGRFFHELKVNPLRMMVIGVAVVLAAFIVRGCLSQNARREGKADLEHGVWVAKNELVPGAVDVICSHGGDSMAADMLKRDAEICVTEAFGRQGKPWSSGNETKLRCDQWAVLLKEVREFVNKSGGEFSYKDISNTRASVIVHPEAVKTFTLDVTALNDRAEVVSEVARAFGVSLAGRAVVGPKPIRKSLMASALKALEEGEKVKVDINDNRLVFRPNYGTFCKGSSNLPRGLSSEEFEAFARKFWKEADAKFDYFPRKGADFAKEFEPMDHDYAEGFEVAAEKLGVLSESISQEAQKASAFLADCDQECLLFTAPADRPTKMRRVDEAMRTMNQLKIKVDRRLSAVKDQADAARLRAAFNTEVERFEATRKKWMADVAELIANAYNKQVARKNALTTLRDEIVSARDRRDFDEISSFSKRIEDAKAVRLNVAKGEDMIVQRVSPTLAFSYVDGAFGTTWARKMKKGFSGLGDASSIVDDKVARFEQEVVGCFCPVGTRKRTLEKALEQAQALAETVCYNHDLKSVRPKGEPSSGTEVDLLAQCDMALSALIRTQRKAQQSAR